MSSRRIIASIQTNTGTRHMHLYQREVDLPIDPIIGMEIELKSSRQDSVAVSNFRFEIIRICYIEANERLLCALEHCINDDGMLDIALGNSKEWKVKL